MLLTVAAGAVVLASGTSRGGSAVTNANRFQFSIRLMLVATAAIAAAVGAVSAEPSAKTCIAITMIATLFAAISVIGAVQTDGTARVFWKSGVLATFFLMAVSAFSLAVVVNTSCYCRSFFIGFLIPAAFVTLGHLQIMQELFLSSRTSFTIHLIENMFSYLSMTKFVDAIILAFCPVIGLFCVLVHFLLWPREPPAAGE